MRLGRIEIWPCWTLIISKVANNKPVQYVHQKLKFWTGIINPERSGKEEQHITPFNFVIGLKANKLLCVIFSSTSVTLSKLFKTTVSFGIMSRVFNENAKRCKYALSIVHYSVAHIPFTHWQLHTQHTL